MQTTGKIKLSKLREIGWSLWDPIGLAGVRPSCPEDEYDSYLVRAAGMLRNGEPQEAVIDWLVESELTHMGISPNATVHTRAQNTVSALEEYLATLPDGPLGLR